MSYWNSWNGDNCPVYGTERVKVVYRNGYTAVGRADTFNWSHEWGDGDIVSYKVLVDDLSRIGKNGNAGEHCQDPAPDPYDKYRRYVGHLSVIDIYQVCHLFGVDDPSGATQHAIKKLLLSGQRTGGKPMRQDLEEARDAIARRLEIADEDS